MDYSGKDYRNRLSYKKSGIGPDKILEQRDFERRTEMLRRKKNDLDRLKTEINLKNRRIEQLNFLWRKVKSEISRAEAEYRKELEDDKKIEENLKKEQKDLTDETSESTDLKKELEEKIKKEKEVIDEHEKVLNQLEKSLNEIEISSEREQRNDKTVISRLLSVFDREKRETERVDKELKELKKKKMSVERDLSLYKGEIVVLENKMRAMERSEIS